MQQFGWLLRRVEYLDLGHAPITDAALWHLRHSQSLKVLTVPFGTGPDVVRALMDIPSLLRLRIPLESIIPDSYLSLADRDHFVANHLVITPKRAFSRAMLPTIFPNVWQQVQ